jgi:hypothetical protein
MRAQGGVVTWQTLQQCPFVSIARWPHPGRPRAFIHRRPSPPFSFASIGALPCPALPLSLSATAQRVDRPTRSLPALRRNRIVPVRGAARANPRVRLALAHVSPLLSLPRGLQCPAPHSHSHSHTAEHTVTAEAVTASERAEPHLHHSSPRSRSLTPRAKRQPPPQREVFASFFDRRGGGARSLAACCARRGGWNCTAGGRAPAAATPAPASKVRTAIGAPLAR